MLNTAPALSGRISFHVFFLVPMIHVALSTRVCTNAIAARASRAESIQSVMGLKFNLYGAILSKFFGAKLLDPALFCPF